MAATTVVSNDGWVPIPAEVRERLGLKGGSTVAFEFGPDGRVSFVPLPDVPLAERPGSRFEALLGMAGPGLSTDEVLAITRGRGEED